MVDIPIEMRHRRISIRKSPWFDFFTASLHDQVALDARIADLDNQVQRHRERNFMLLWLSRLSFGLWRF